MRRLWVDVPAYPQAQGSVRTAACTVATSVARLVMRIGTAQVLVHHVELDAAINLGTLLCLMFDRMDDQMIIHSVSVGVAPGLAATWFVFRGELR